MVIAQYLENLGQIWPQSHSRGYIKKNLGMWMLWAPIQIYQGFTCLFVSGFGGHKINIGSMYGGCEISGDFGAQATFWSHAKPTSKSALPIKLHIWEVYALFV